MRPKSIEYFREDDSASLALDIGPTAIPRKGDTIVISGHAYSIDEVVWNLNSQRISVILSRN